MAQQPGTISGIVMDAQGRPVEQARIYFVDGPVPLPEIASLTNNDGAFTLTAPAPGAYQIECATDTFAPVRAAVTVQGGKESHVKFKLRDQP